MNATMKRFAKFTPVWAFVLAMGLAPSLWAEDAPDLQLVAEDTIDDVILDTRTVREIAVTDPAAVASEGLTFSASGWGAAAEGAAAISCTRNSGDPLDFATGLAGDGVTNWTPVVNGTFVFTHTPDDEGGVLTATYKVTGFTTTITVPADLDYNYGFSVSNRTTGAVYEAVENKFTVETGDDYDLIITPPSSYRFVDPTENGIVPYDFLTEAKTIAKGSLPAIEEVEYLHFTAVGGELTISMTDGGEPLTLEWSTDKSAATWVEFIAGESNAVVAAGETIYFRRKGADVADKLDCWQFVLEATGTVEADGNVMSLLDRTCRSKTVGEYAFKYLFKECTALTSAPELPATNLAEHCYLWMFSDCRSLTNAPALPAMELAEGCYDVMFSSCASLTTAPELPATNLAAHCYNGMFSGCTSLTNAPVLPATNLVEGCYSGMFKGCTSLTTAPELPAMEWASQCYVMMFQNCTNLNSLTVGFTNWCEDVMATAYWLANVAPTGIFLCPPALEIKRDGSHIPEGWLVNPQTFTVKTPLPEHVTGYTMENLTDGSAIYTNGTDYAVSTNDQVKITLTPEEGYDFVSGDGSITATISGAGIVIGEEPYKFPEVYKQDYLSFTAHGGEVKIEMRYSVSEGGNPDNLDALLLETAPSMDGPWTDFLAMHATNTITDGATVYFRRKGEDTVLTFNLINTYYTFVMTADSGVTVEAGGNMMSLLDKTCRQTEVGTNAFCSLFSGCSQLTSAPALPATKLAEGCYMSMFSGCESLTNAPALPATNLAENCYSGMFVFCTSLTNAPALPATELAEGCYASMFIRTALTNAPALPATKMEESCYSSMFYGCTSLTTAPELPATNLTEMCYAMMFMDCTNLNSVTVGFTNWCDEDAYATMSWLSNVAPTGTFYCPPALEIKRGTSNIPNGWLANPQAFSVATPLPEGVELKPFNNLTEGSAIYTNTFGFTDYAASSNDLIELTFKTQNGYRFIDGDVMLDSTVVTAKIDKADYVIGDDIAFPTAKRVYTFDLPRSKGMINASYVVTNGTTDISDKYGNGIDSESRRYTVVTGTTTTITFASYVPSSSGGEKKSFLRFPEVDGVLVTNPMVIAEISEDHIYKWNPHETPYGVEAIDVTIPGVSNMTYYVSNTVCAAETFYPEDCGVTNVFRIAKAEDTVFVFTPADGFRFKDETEEAKNPITVKKYADYTIQDSEIPQVVRNMNTLRLSANVAGLDYVVTNNGAKVTGTLNGDYWEYLISMEDTTANIYFLIEDGYTVDGGYSNPLSTNVTEDVVTIGAGAPGMPKVVYWYKVQYTNGPETNKTDTVKQDAEYAISEDIYPKAGYTFLGWTNTEAEVAIYTNNQVVMNLTTTPGGTVTLTAVHQPNGYTLTYKSGEGEGDDIDTNLVYDVEYTAAENTFTKTGYSFVYWTNDVHGVIYAGDAISNLTTVAGGNVDFMAVYTANVYQITFDSKGGSSVDPIVASCDEAIEAPAVPTRLGYTFAGWFTNNAEAAYGFTTMPAGGLELFAKWNANAYKLVYVAGDGEGAPITNDCVYADVYTTSNGVFTKRGYTQTGWTNLVDKIGYDFGSSISNLTAEANGVVTFTAVYAPNEYTVKYTDGAGHEAVSNATFDVEFAISESVFAKEGYHFTGWTNETDNVVYQPNAIVSNLTASGEYELTAVWVPNKYEVKYVANGGVGDDLYTTNTYDKPFNAASTNGFTKTGYHFTHWTNATHSIEAGGECLNLSTGDSVTLYAAWVANGYKLAYEPGAGDGAAITNDCVYDVEYVVSNTVFSRTGYVQAGWTNLATGIGYEFGQTVTNLTDEVDGVVVLTATWTPNDYTVKYTDGAEGVATSNATYDVAFAIGENVFEKTGYHFTGWTNETDNVGYQPNEIVSNLTAEADGVYLLKAVWVPNEYEVKYVANGGEGADLYTTNTYDKSFNAASTNGFTKTGYHFTHWTNATHSIEAGGEYSNLSTGDSVTLYAAWVANGYKLAYEPGAGEGAAITNDCVYDVEYVVSNKVFSRTGYEQAGWTNLVTGIGYEFGQMVTNLTDEVDGVAVLTATWTPNEYKVKYVANGGEGEPAVSNATYDVEFAISENVFEKEGYHFTGWTNEADSVGYQPGDIVSNLTASGVYELTAVWVPNKYEVKYVANGGEGADLYTTNTYDEAFTAAGADVFTKPGYTYSIWTNANGDVIAVGSECMNLSTGDSVTLYAAWVANTYTLAYTPGDGTGTTKYDTLTYDDETYTAIEMPGDFAKYGHTFCCWTNGAGKSFLPGEPVSNLTTVAFATNYFGAAWTANVHTVTMPADVGPMTYVVSNETTGAEITVTDNKFQASFGDEIKIYFTAELGYMLVGENTAYSFTVVDEDKIIAAGDLPCVSKFIIADWSDTVGVTNVEWNATNAVALINDKSKAVWVQFRYNFDDGSPIRETLPEGFGFRFEGGEGDGWPATFTTVPASSAALRKVSITGVLNTYCLTPLPADENYYIGDRLAYEADAINAAPGGTNTEIKIEHAFIPVNPVVGVGTNAEAGCGIVTIVAENIDHDDAAVVLLGTNGVIKLLNYDEKGIITAPRGYEVRVEEDEGYKVYTVVKIGVVSVTVNDEDPIALLDEDIPDFVADLEDKLVENPFDLYCITFNDDVDEFGTLRNVSEGTFVLLAGSWREIYAPEDKTIGFVGGEIPAETVRTFVEGAGVQLMSETVVNGELTSYVAVTSDYSVVVSNALYLAGGIALGDGAKLKLAKGGVICAKGDIAALIEAAEGCELVSSHDEYREWFIYVCRVNGATEVTVGGSETVTAADEIALAAILADSVVKPANDEVTEYFEKSGKFAEYQALFAFGCRDNGNGTYTINPELKDEVKEEITASLNAAAAKIVHNLRAESVPVETKVGLYYGVKSGTEAGSLGDPAEWVMGTGGTVQLPFEAKGASGFYEVVAQPYKAEAPQ